MKIFVDNIIYDDRVKEWNVHIDTLRGWKAYIDNPISHVSSQGFKDFLSFGVDDPPKTLIVDVPFYNLEDSIDQIEKYIKSEIKKKTYRDVKSMRITVIE